MSSKLSARAQLKLDALGEARRKWDRVHHLVEMVATQKVGHDMYFTQIRRAAEDVSRVFLNNGYGPLADSAKQMALLVRRGGTMQSKMRSMREQVGSVRAGIERAERAVIAEDQAPPGD